MLGFALIVSSAPFNASISAPSISMLIKSTLFILCFFRASSSLQNFAFLAAFPFDACLLLEPLVSNASIVFLSHKPLGMIVMFLQLFRLMFFCIIDAFVLSGSKQYTWPVGPTLRERYIAKYP